MGSRGSFQIPSMSTLRKCQEAVGGTKRVMRVPVGSRQKAEGRVPLRPHPTIRLLLTAYCLLPSVTTGCAYAPLRAADPAPRPLPAELAAYYEYPDHHPKAAVEPVADRRRFRGFLLRLPL